MFMRSDSIHDAVLCAERRGRTPARSIDTALLARPYTRNCDYLIINPVSLRHSFSVREVCRCWQTLFADRRSKSQGLFDLRRWIWETAQRNLGLPVSFELGEEPNG